MTSESNNRAAIESIETDIAEIHRAMAAHNEDDKYQFQSLRDNMNKDKEDRDKYHITMMEEVGKIRNEIQSLNQTVSPVVKFFDNVTFSKTAFMWILGILGTIVGLALGIRELLRKA